ncbi:MAG: S-layer homology domain-containing protein [Peptococcaceae bacterium]|nr:S-layer homology domain-containing protein [Peptococcaceae bacterium]
MLSKRRNLLILCLSLLLVLSLVGTAYAQPADIKGHWAEKQISNWVDNELIAGYPDGTFKPDNSITRAEFAVLANKACGYTASAPVTFSDVNTADWYYGEVARAVAAGYISGYPDGTFKPNGEITRQEVAVVIARILELDITSVDALSVFKDAEAIPQWSQGFVNAVVAAEYMRGYPDQTFQAAKSITRAEAVVTLDNAIAIETVTTYTYDEAGTYGPETDTATVEGNAMITVPGVTLQNTLITGNLLLGEGIGDGDVTLKNITVKGNTTIKGGGADSVYLEDCTLPNITISREGVRVVASGSTSVNIVTLESGATLVEVTLDGEGFEKVVVSQVVPAEAAITLEGNFTAVEVNAKDAKIEIPSESKVETLTLNAATKVTGKGAVVTTLANVDGSTIEGTITTTTVTPAPNVSITAGNKTYTSDEKGEVTVTTESPPSGGGNGGNGTGSATEAKKAFLKDLRETTGKILPEVATIIIDDNDDITVTFAEDATVKGARGAAEALFESMLNGVDFGTITFTTGDNSDATLAKDMDITKTSVKEIAAILLGGSPDAAEAFLSGEELKFGYEASLKKGANFELKGVLILTPPKPSGI